MLPSKSFKLLQSSDSLALYKLEGNSRKESTYFASLLKTQSKTLCEVCPETPSGAKYQ